MERIRHPWSTDFTWPRVTDTPATLSAAQVRAYDDDGFFVVADAFTPDELAALDAALAPGDEQAAALLAQVPGGRFSVAGLDTQVVAPHAVLRSAVARAFCAHPVLAGIARDLLGPDVRLYWEQSVYKQPNGAEPVLWHQDNGYAYVHPESYLTCWVAITDATIENGCVHVMPGVHREGTLVHATTPIGQECWGDWDSAVAVPVRAGSVVVFTSLTPHATPVNHTGSVRKAYIVQYVADGAEVWEGDPAAGDPRRRVPQTDPDRQPFVVRDGVRVDLGPLRTIPA
jgi:ectoine hydroxylase-related dioxygenase (phytanoyl-CoA dioxygenase family)